MPTPEKARIPLRSSGYRLPTNSCCRNPGRNLLSSRREHHMTNILAFFSTRTLLQIAFILASTVAMKAWSLGLFFVG